MYIYIYIQDPDVADIEVALREVRIYGSIEDERRLIKAKRVEIL
jgi:hypothetical protein